MVWVDCPTGIDCEPGVPDACPPPRHPPGTTTRTGRRQTLSTRAHRDRMTPIVSADTILDKLLVNLFEWQTHGHAKCCGCPVEAHRAGAGELGGRVGRAPLESGVRRGRTRRGSPGTSGFAGAAGGRA